MALAFPANPTLNQSYTSNGKSWIWNSTSWVSSTIPYNINNQTVASYTAAASDLLVPIIMTNAGANSVVIPANTFPLGSNLAVVQGGAGTTTLVAASGVTLQPYSTLVSAGQNSTMFLIQISTNVWVVGGATK